MSRPLEGKVALITGSSKGIGRATAFRLAQDGAKVVVNYSRGADAAAKVVEDIGSEYTFAVQADASKIFDIEVLIGKTVAKFGKIDILVASAGVLPMKDLENTTEEDFDRAFALNVKGPYFLVQKAAPYLSDNAHVVLFSSTLCTASTVTPNYLLYNTTKGAVEQMTRVLCKDLARRGVSVNAVAPGPTGTELFFKGKSEETLKAIAGFNPHNRIGSPEEIADVVAFLASDNSRWVTGQVVRVNGGMA